MAFALRRPYGRLDDPDAGAAEHLVEGVAVLAVAVAYQEAHAVREVEAEIAPCWVTHGPVGLDEQPAATRTGWTARSQD
jgi:hypothetical protein